MLCYFLKRSLILVFRSQNCHEIIWEMGGWSFFHCIEKCSAQLLRKKDPKCLPCKVWTTTIDFHADVKHNRNQRYLSWGEGKTTKQNWSEEENVILLRPFTYWCQSIPMCRSLGSKARLLVGMRVQLRMDVSNPAKAKRYTRSFQCLSHLHSCHSADFAGGGKHVMHCAWHGR